MEMQNKWGTNDLFLAAFFKVKGLEFEAVKKGNRVKFIFEDNEERQRLLKGYFSNAIDVKPLQFVNAIKDLKTMVYNL